MDLFTYGLIVNISVIINFLIKFCYKFCSEKHKKSYSANPRICIHKKTSACE